MSIKFCCQEMKDQIRKQDNPTPEDRPSSLLYDPVERLFGLYANRGETIMKSDIDPIYYCPFCGTKLPTWLGGEYDEYNIELEKAVGRKKYKNLFYKDPETRGWCLDRSKTPKEFQTDEWWIKRGL